jgi:polyisoprenoid-binding protein YceI
MKKIFLLFVLSMSYVVFAQNFTNDKNHSKLGFAVTHLKISTVEGDFKNFTVQLSSFYNQDITATKFHVVAQVNSISTGIEGRDNHLKSADFFDTANYPKLEFTSKSISKVKKNIYKLVGDLTLHGVTKQVSLNLIYNGSVDNHGIIIYGFTIKGKIDRIDFNIGTDFTNAVVSNMVEISANLQFPTHTSSI